MAEIVTCSVAERTTRPNFEEIRHIAGYSSDQEVTNAATILCEVSSSNLGQAQSDQGNSVEHQETGDETTDRRSKRRRKPVRRLSLSTLEEEPTEDDDDGGAVRAPSTSAGSATTSRILNPKKPRDKRGRNEDELFCCDICKSNSIIPPKRKKGTGRRSWRVSVRYWVDPETNKKLKLCNACGLRANRNRNPTPRQEHATPEERNKYFENVQKFSQSLISELKDPDAERLTCPYFRTRTPCACIQKFIVGEGNNMEEAKKRAGRLLQLVKEAQRLRSKKFYNVEEVMKKSKRNRRVGMGNGQRKSKEYEDLVLTKRAVLKEQLKFCEHATKRILLYSNNFLHKRLKTDPVLARRLEKTTGGPKKTLKEIKELPEMECCEDSCVLLARTHSVLLQRWRDRARKGQAEARKVLGEMLTPSGLRVNCHKFITMVTGCSTATVARVEQQMRLTGGDRDPPPHGLKKYWEQQNRAGKAAAAPKKLAEPVTISLSTEQRNPAPPPTKSEKQLKDQLLQLKKMQQKLVAQQNEINQQTKNLEKQLNLINKQKGALKTAPTTQYTHIQPKPAQSSKETIGIPAMTIPESSVLETIDPRVQQNMNQLLNQIQNQIANQTMLQIQQQLLSDVVKDSGTTLGATNQPPPSYNVAVALSNGASLGQTGLGVPGQLILQALPVSCGDTITIHTQPVEGATVASGSNMSSLGILAQGDCQEEDQGQDASTSATQSLLVSISDMIRSEDSLDREMPMPEVIEIPETEPFSDAPFTDDLQAKSTDIPNQQSLLNDIEETISSMTPIVPAPRSTAAILRKKPRNIAPAAPAVTVANVVGFQRVIVRPSHDPQPLAELPGDMLMPSDPLQALSSANQSLLLQTIPVNTRTETSPIATTSSS